MRGGFLYTWIREGRIRKWQLEDAKRLAEKVTQDASNLADKISKESISLATKVNLEAVAMAAKVVEDASRLAEKVHTASETLVGKVTENTSVSSIAAIEAKNAFSEANSINNKIANLTSQLLVISNYIKDAETKRERMERVVKEEALFNERIQAAINQAVLRIPPLLK